MEQWRKQWETVYQSLKQTHKYISDEEKQKQLKTLHTATEFALDTWAEMEEKVNLLEEEIDDVDESVTTYTSKGTSYFKLNMFDHAIVEFQKEKNKFWKHQELLQLYIGFSQLYTNKFDQAKETFLYLLHLRPSMIEKHFAYVGLGCLHSQHQQFDEALTFYEKALSLTMNSDVVYNIGMCHYNLDEPHLAIPYFKKSIKLIGEDGESYYYLGRCYSMLEQPTKAFEAWMSALQIAETKEFLLALAYEFEWLGYYLAALHCYKRLVTLGYTDHTVNHGLAWNYGLLDERSKSKELFTALIERNPTDVNIFISYLWLLKTWGEHQQIQAVLMGSSKSILNHPLIERVHKIH
ncbi:tetratricopeptide repeat protein [Bacillus sp. FJAT-45350]|uniref:tetratricopeptide repeat protein n=1 Tax=Bacillus sp. FJAT-45350 TaxID=2011014 RepID=UPI000BB8AF60|nr:tetratricopeptide repeat protein [Bacillus sp. FJAT-45350]